MYKIKIDITDPITPPNLFRIVHIIWVGVFIGFVTFDRIRITLPSFVTPFEIVPFDNFERRRCLLFAFQLRKSKLSRWFVDENSIQKTRRIYSTEAIILYYITIYVIKSWIWKRKKRRKRNLEKNLFENK